MRHPLEQEKTAEQLGRSFFYKYRWLDRRKSDELTQTTAMKYRMTGSFLRADTSSLNDSGSGFQCLIVNVWSRYTSMSDALVFKKNLDTAIMTH